MFRKLILGIICVIIVLVMLFGNRKARVCGIFEEQFFVFKNAKRDRISLWDLVCFILMPMVVGAILAFGLDCVIDDNLASVLTTAFSFVFTILFGFAAILVSKLENSSGIVKRVVRESFISLMTCTLIALFSTILSICIIIVENNTAITTMSFLVWSLSIMMVMLILMVSKRVHKVYCDNANDEKPVKKEND